MPVPRVPALIAAALFALLLPAACVVSAQRPFPAAPAPPPAVTSFDVVLAPYGDFIAVAGVGRVWRPHLAVVGPGFVPYLSGGRWVYTSAGWVFQSRWEFGWAVFHYGHWAELPSVGWVWLPGDEWAPAWVEWQAGGGFVAWAPAPPPLVVMDWRPRWCFVEARMLVTEDWIERHLLPVSVLHRANAVLSRIHREPGRPVSIGPPPGYVERSAGVPVRIHEVTPPPPRGIGPVKVLPWSPPPTVVPAPPARPTPPAPPAVIPAPPARPPVAPPAAPRKEGSPPAVRPPPPGQPTPPPGHREHKDQERTDRQPGASRAVSWKHAIG